MKTIKLTAASPTLPEVLHLAGDDEVVLETREGRRFIVAELDDFNEEIGAVVRNKALMKLLAKRAKETATIPLGAVRRRLNQKQKSNGRVRSKKNR